MKKFIYLICFFTIAFFSFNKSSFKKAKPVLLSSKYNPYLMPPPSNRIDFRNYNSEVVTRSSNGQFQLSMQSDGNLVLYNSANQALWASGPTTYPDGSNVAHFQADGNIVLYRGNSNLYWAVNSTVTTGAGYSCSTVDNYGLPTTAIAYSYWILQDDGNLVRYNNDGSGSISTDTYGGRKSNHFGQIR